MTQEASDPARQSIDQSEQATTDRKRSRRRGRVIVYGKWCKECGLCIAFCPHSVLGSAPDGSTIVLHPDACTACRWCELHCPDFAITVKVLDRED